MKIPKDELDRVTWERNVLALMVAEGWYYDEVPALSDLTMSGKAMRPRFPGWHRALSLASGHLVIHVPDDFDMGRLPWIKSNWDKRSTEEQFCRALKQMGIEVEA